MTDATLTALLVGVLIGLWVHRIFGGLVFRVRGYKDGQSRWIMKWERKDAGK